MAQNKQTPERAINYLCDKRKIDKAIIYNELLPRKLIGYLPEMNSLAFPLMRGFLIVGIQYTAMEPIKFDGDYIQEGKEYFHAGSDLTTGIFSLQRNFKEVVVTVGIVDLLSTNQGGISIPDLVNLDQLRLFYEMDTTICFKNIKGLESACERALKIIPKAKIIKLPKVYGDINQMLMVVILRAVFKQLK